MSGVDIVFIAIGCFVYGVFAGVWISTELEWWRAKRFSRRFIAERKEAK